MATSSARAPARHAMSRFAAIGLVAGLAVIGPLLESWLGGGGRGYAIGMLMMLLAPSLVREGGARLHPLDPETFVPAMYFLSAGYAPTLHLLSSKYLALSHAEVNGFEVAFVGSVGCALVCVAGSRAPAGAAEGGLDAKLLPRDWAVILTGLVGAAMIGVWIAQTGLGRLLASSYAETYQQEEGKGILVSGWFFIQLSLVHSVARALDFRRLGRRVPRVLFVAMAVMFTAFLFNTLLGRRGPILWVLVAAALCAHLSGFRVRRWWLFAAAAALPIYAYALEGYRTELGSGAEERLAAAQAGLERLDNPLVVPELENVFATLVVMVEQQPPILHYPGESWVNALLIQIPKPIWRDRPTALSERYVQWAAPSFAREGGGFAFNTTAEGYLNLGAVGAFLQAGFVAGVFFFFPLVFCMARPRGPLARALCTSMASFAYNQFRGELASVMKITVALLGATALVLVASVLIERFIERFSAAAPGPRGSRSRAVGA